MCMRLRGLIALVIAVSATDGANARRHSSPVSPYAAFVSRSRAPAALAVDDASPGPLKIPDAALEPADWEHLDGWARDDHASATRGFATIL